MYSWTQEHVVQSRLKTFIFPLWLVTVAQYLHTTAIPNIDFSSQCFLLNAMQFDIVIRWASSTWAVPKIPVIQYPAMCSLDFCFLPFPSLLTSTTYHFHIFFEWHKVLFKFLNFLCFLYFTTLFCFFYSATGSSRAWCWSTFV